ncbi:MAG: ABC transporter substrate-binding protein [Chloroflexi bacterium]|nr:ABC transporter substrate-binding protein [Chloroflexota bacterium]
MSGPKGIIRRFLAYSGAAAALLLSSCGSTGAGPAAVAPTGTAPSKPAVASGAPASSTPQREIVLAVSRDLANGEKDPYYAHSSLMVWESLIALDDQLKPTPQLAESWQSSADSKTWTFHLRHNVSFTDGTPFNADAVVANIQRYLKISPRTSPFFLFDAKAAFGDLASVTKLDDYTVTFNLNSPNASLPFTMTNFYSAMFSPKSFTPDGDFTGIPSTTGPFMLKDWQRGQYMLLQRNDNYWGTKAQAASIRLRVIPDASARVSALLAKEVDGVAELGALLPAQAKDLTGRPGITVAADPISITQYLAFNVGQAPFNNVQLRDAVAMAMDRRSIVDRLLNGYATPGKGLLSPVATQWASTKPDFEYDPDKAKALAQAALGGSRVKANFVYAGGAGQARPYDAIAALLQSSLAPLGIDVSLVSVDQAAVNQRTANGDWNLRIAQQGWANGDPDFIFRTFMRSDGAANAGNKSGYSSAQADRLIDAGQAEADPQKRLAIYQKLQDIASQDAPVLPLYYELSPYAYRDSITGLKQRVTYQPTLELVHLTGN